MSNLFRQLLLLLMVTNQKVADSKGKAVQFCLLALPLTWSGVHVWALGDVQTYWPMQVEDAH